MSKEKPTKKELDLRNEFRKRVLTYITTAFGLVVGLAWNDAIKSLIEIIFPLESDGVVIKFLYAILVTVLLVFVTVYLFRFFEKEDK
ncbi:MAG: DUF5654 family protein [Candidatus Marinimicrobia bacterium]|nr:DUF5654 family protein [Candidatus Neomarinimicrobiota bacterium]